MLSGVSIILVKITARPAADTGTGAGVPGTVLADCHKIIKNFV